MDTLVQRVINELKAQLEAVERRALSAAEGATHEESRPEDPKDTRGLETSYLAHGLAQRAKQLEDDIEMLRFLSTDRFDSETPITTGALVTLEDDDGVEKCLLMLPCAGGTEVSHKARTVHVVTPGSPLGAALLEKCEGDDVQVRIAGKMREYVVSSVSNPSDP
ncbi:MAG: GreA/GreB family elongation factor [Myxococcota bacterium]